MRKLSVLLIVFFFSCNTSTIETKSNVNNKSNVVLEAMKQLPGKKVKDYVILIPQNSCGGCRNYIFDNYKNLYKISDLQLIYLKYGDTIVKPDNAGKINTIHLEPIERKYDLYGITLYSMNGDSIIKKITLNPTNIKIVVDSLLNK